MISYLMPLAEADSLPKLPTCNGARDEMYIGILNLWISKNYKGTSQACCLLQNTNPDKSVQ